MMELLVAVLVMGIGVLGVTGLQLVSLQNNQDAMLRAEAVQHAYDILDRIRVNPGVGIPGAAYDGVDIDDDPPNVVDDDNCHMAACTDVEMVQFDIAVWKCSLGGHNQHDSCGVLRADDILPPTTEQPGLPDGDGSIEVDGNGIVSITVEWQGFDNTTQSITITSQG